MTEPFERRCPKCGHDMRIVPGSSNTLHGVRTCDAMCANCLHVEQVTFLVARKGK